MTTPRSPATSVGSPTAVTRDIMVPALTPKLLKYHTVPWKKLGNYTELQLAAAGVSTSALGRRDGASITVTGCINLTPHAQHLLPADLGGSSTPGPRSGSSGLHSPARSLQSGVTDGSTSTPGAGPPLDSPSALAALARAAASEARAVKSAQAASEAHARLASLRPRRGRPDSDPSSSAPTRGLFGSEASSARPGESAAGISDDAEYADAAAHAAALAQEASDARDEASSDADTVISCLRPAPSGWSPSPSHAPSHGRTDVDASREQQILVASVTTLGQTAEAVAVLAGYREKYPNIYRAFTKMSGDFPRHAPTDFPTTVLVPAVHAARVQEHGLATLRAASLAQAPLAGPRGVFAATNLGDLFDYWAAQALLDGDIQIEASPLDACLGVLPLAQLALHFWYRDHYHKELPESPLASAAARASFAPGGVLTLQLGLDEFLPLWGAAL